MKIAIATILLLMVLSVSPVQAQFIPTTVSLSASPESPSPGQTFTVTAATPLFDRESADFTWEVGGSARRDLSGFGKNTITLRAGGVGNIITVSVTVLQSVGQGGSDTISVRTADLVLTWYAETYTPKWYKGKALPAQNSVVDVVALPNIILGGSRVSPAKLVYHWSLDDDDRAHSGVGEQVFRVKISPYSTDANQVRVIIEDTEKRIRKTGQILIAPQQARAVIYPYTPLGGGEWRNGTSSYTLTKRGLFDVAMEPFFFPVTSRSSLQYSWRVNNQDIAGDVKNPHLLTLDTAGMGIETIPTSVVGMVKNNDTFSSPISRIVTIFFK